jgi:predicted RNA-binding protein YlxR (DUF448 family)
MISKKIPERMCVVCRTHKDKRELLRVVCHKEDGLLVDTTGKINGRGAYICKDIACVDKAEKSSALQRAFKRDVDKAFYALIRKEIAEHE